jgi:hypothetical protein
MEPHLGAWDPSGSRSLLDPSIEWPGHGLTGRAGPLALRLGPVTSSNQVDSRYDEWNLGKACSRSAPSSKATIALVRSFSTNSRPACGRAPAAHPAAPARWRPHLGRAGDLRLQPAADDGGRRMIHTPSARPTTAAATPTRTSSGASSTTAALPSGLRAVRARPRDYRPPGA